MISPLLRRYTWNSAWLYNVRILSRSAARPRCFWWIGEVKLTIPLTLGVVAAALTDLDRLAGRLRNLAITLVCFYRLRLCGVSVSVVAAVCPWFDRVYHRLYFAQRPRSALCDHCLRRLLIAIYTMLGVTLYDHWYLQPLFLLAGAVWYNLLTLSGH